MGYPQSLERQNELRARQDEVLRLSRIEVFVCAVLVACIIGLLYLAWVI